jgi:hypothetical protein
LSYTARRITSINPTITRAQRKDCYSMTITLPWWFPIPGLVIAVFAAILAIKNYRRKSGLQIRGNFQFTSSNTCTDRYVSRITFENIKDRAVTVFAIYLRVGHNYFIELENFEGKPITLKAYETYNADFGPIQFYRFNSRKFNLNKILDDPKVKKRLVLSTGDGKYTIPRSIKVWNPLILHFQNLMTAIVEPQTLMFKDHYIGSGVDFVVTVTYKGRKDEIILLKRDDYKFKRFQDFQLTQESLTNKESLDKFLRQQIQNGVVNCEAIAVNETSEWTAQYNSIYQETIEAKAHGWFTYYVKGRIFTWFGERRRTKMNANTTKTKR